MVPMAGQDAIGDRAAVQREAEMRAAIVERKDAAAIVDDEQRALAGLDDARAFGLELGQGAGAQPILAARWVGRLVRNAGAGGFGHRAGLHAGAGQRPPIAAVTGAVREARLPPPAGSGLSARGQPAIADCSADPPRGMNQRESRLSSRPARRWRWSAMPRWLGRTLMPNSLER